MKNKKGKKQNRLLRIMLSRKIVVICLIILLVMVIMAVFSPLVAPYDPYKQDLRSALQPMSAQHWLGTDSMGRDVFSRIVYGTRVSLLVGIASVIIAGGIGMVLGVVSGLAGGVVDSVIMRVMDAMMSIPMLILAMFLGSILGKGLGNVMLSVGISMAPSYARLVRGQVLTLRGSDYVTAATVCGASVVRNTISHIVPGCLSPMIVMMTMNLGGAILAEANLSFLGMGISPPTASWGGMVSDGYSYLGLNPVIAIAPGVCVLLIVLCFNMVGDAVRDALDPRLRGTI